MQTRQYFSKKKTETWIKLTGFSDAAPRLYCPCRIVICLHTEHRGVLKSSFKRVRAFQIELEFGSVGFWREVKTGVPGKNLTEQRREPRTNSTHIWRRRRDSNGDYIGGTRLLSPLYHPWSPIKIGGSQSKNI